MRPIKFRTWDKLTNTMVGDGFHLFGEFMMFRLLETYIIEHPVPHSVNSGLQYELWRYENIEVMQFTGLHDKNGKEIYEGDIIDQETELGTFRSVISWDEKDTCFHPFYPCKWREVVGNIHENPELLPKKEDQP